jgi:hypothetical protein
MISKGKFVYKQKKIILKQSNRRFRIKQATGDYIPHVYVMKFLILIKWVSY